MTSSGLSAWHRLPRWLALVTVVAWVVLVFAPVLTFGFVYDDHHVLLDNGFLRLPQHWPRLLGSTSGIPDRFRPTSVVFEGIAMQLIGAGPGVQHGLSLGLHALVTLLLARWLAWLDAPRAVQVASAAVFGVLAIHAEPIAVVSYREDLLAAALGLAACLLAERSARHLSTRRALALGLGASLVMALACLAKLSAAPLPAVWWLVSWLRPWATTRSRPHLPALALLLGCLLALVARVSWFGGIAVYDAARTHAIADVAAGRVCLQLLALVKMVVPVQLSPHYEPLAIGWADPAPWLSLAAMLLGLGYALAVRRSRPVLALVVLGTALLLLPTAPIIPLPIVMADRFEYLPSVLVSIGLAVAVVTAGERLDPGQGGPSLVPLLMLVALHSSAARVTAAAYRSDTRLWSTVLRRDPGSPRAHAVMGQLLLGSSHRSADPNAWLRDPLARSNAHCQLALREDARWGHLCRARWLEHHGHRRDALAHLDAVEPPAHLHARWLVARAHLEPRPHMQRQLVALAQAKAPYSAHVFTSGGEVLHRLGQPDAARRSYDWAAVLQPRRPGLLDKRVALELDLGDAEEAERLLTTTTVPLEHRITLLRTIAFTRALLHLDPHAP